MSRIQFNASIYYAIIITICSIHTDDTYAHSSGESPHLPASFTGSLLEQQSEESDSIEDLTSGELEIDLVPASLYDWEEVPGAQAPAGSLYDWEEVPGAQAPAGSLYDWEEVPGAQAPAGSRFD